MPTENEAERGTDEPETSRDIVTEASMDSFPASDPPGWIRSSAATCDPTPPAVEVVEFSSLPPDLRPSATSGPELRRLKRIALASGVAVIASAIGAFLFVRSRRRVYA